MRLSETATLYLEKLNRDKAYTISNRSGIERYLVQHNFPILNKIVDFQVEYSGLELTIYNKPGATFRARLFSLSEIINNQGIDMMDIEGQRYLDCGDHQTAQFWFVIGENGEICTYDNTDYSVNPIFSSFDKLIETYALRDLLSKNNKYEHPPNYHLIDKSGFINFTSNYLPYAMANDRYNQWMSLNEITFHIGTWYDKPSEYLSIYGPTKFACEEILQNLLKSNFIR